MTSLPCVCIETMNNHGLQSNYYIKIKHLEGRFERETFQGLSEGIVKIVRSIITKYLLY